MAFCKLFEHEQHGQILVMRQEGDEGPEIRFFVQPREMGVCSFAIGFGNNDAAEDLADAAFTKVDYEQAAWAASEICDQVEKLTH